MLYDEPVYYTEGEGILLYYSDLFYNVFSCIRACFNNATNVSLPCIYACVCVYVYGFVIVCYLLCTCSVYLSRYFFRLSYVFFFFSFALIFINNYYLQRTITFNHNVSFFYYFVCLYVKRYTEHVQWYSFFGVSCRLSIYSSSSFLFSFLRFIISFPLLLLLLILFLLFNLVNLVSLRSNDSPFISC